MNAAELQPAARLNRGDSGLDHVRVDGLRVGALQPEDDSSDGAVATASGGQRAVQLGAYRRDAIQHSAVTQLADERRRSPHRADGVRTRRTDADFEQVERTDGHTAAPGVSSS